MHSTWLVVLFGEHLRSHDGAGDARSPLEVFDAAVAFDFYIEETAEESFFEELVEVACERGGIFELVLDCHI